MTSDDIVCISFLYLLLLYWAGLQGSIFWSPSASQTNKITYHASLDLSIFYSSCNAFIFTVFYTLLLYPYYPFYYQFSLYLPPSTFLSRFPHFPTLISFFFKSNDFEVHAPLSNPPRYFKYTTEHVFLSYLSSSSPSLPSLSRILLMLFLITSVTSSTWRLWVSYYTGAPYSIPTLCRASLTSYKTSNTY
jgi:hypothetical protein